MRAYMVYRWHCVIRIRYLLPDFVQFVSIELLEMFHCTLERGHL